MTKNDNQMSDAVRHERERCVQLVEAYDGMFIGFEAMLVTRLENIIRNGIVPESFADQMSSDEETEYWDPDTVEDERQRCIDCIDIHDDDSTSPPIKQMLTELRQAIVTGRHSGDR